MFFQRLSNGWTLAMQSWRVLMDQKSLLLLPLVSGIACLFVLASFAVPLYATGYAGVVFEDESKLQDPLSILILFAFYFANYFVIAFFNSALVACVVKRWRGEDASIAAGFSVAVARLPQILGWALVAATVGVALRLLESRSENIGKFVAGLLGLAWSIMTYFVVPVLVVERVGPIEAAKRSASILRRTWGESIGANFGVGMITFIGMAICLVPIVLGGMMLSAGAALIGGVLIAVGVAGMIVVGLISSALDVILTAALYHYATSGTVPAYYDGRVFGQAFV